MTYVERLHSTFHRPPPNGLTVKHGGPLSGLWLGDLPVSDREVTSSTPSSVAPREVNPPEGFVAGYLSPTDGEG
ncbi:hypothetical protein N658DRAFT_96534 [Parathielavia hyrcaniae]|uniref:Uncharacterized protein n=1 Tax=Parathielavia hyrcaniae TaxID=113614 RepID=A0AAN6Q3V3_9PEZI|nr:hypothetical protein N658DRAFT_96534 [Parathielavia hyrcaniae]